MTRLVLGLIVGIAALMPSQVHAQSYEAVKQKLRDETVRVARDPSFRTRLAVPLVDFNAEVAKDKKTATAKVGFDFGDNVVSEIGVTGVFDESGDRSALTSLRDLTPGSELWVALNWRRYRVKAVHSQLEQVCREAAWAIGKSFGEFICRETTLSSTSFAARLQKQEIESNVPLICTDFSRAVGTAIEVVRGQSSLDCRRSESEILQSIRSLGETVKDQLSTSYAVRYAAATSEAEKLTICNEYRRSEGLPPTRSCDATALADQPNWKRSWQARFDAATVAEVTNRVRLERNAQMAEICAEADRARGITPTGRAECADQSEIFNRSFKERYSAAYRWAYTPIVGVRHDRSRHKFEFVNAILTPQASQTETSRVWTGTVGILTPGGTLMAVNYANSSSWKAQSMKIVCEPLANTNATTCGDRIIGGPQREDRQQTEVEIKRRLAGTFAVGLYLTRDHELNAWGFEVPIYFVKNDMGGLSGGIVTSYRSDMRRYDVSVFIGQAFDLYGDR